MVFWSFHDTVDGIHRITLMTLDYRNYGKFLIMGNAGFLSSTLLVQYTWRFMGSYKWGYKSLYIGYNHSSPTYDHTYSSSQKVGTSIPSCP